MNKAVIYTAISGQYDLLKIIPYGFIFGCDAIAFVEEQSNRGWQSSPLHNYFNDAKMNSKFYKVNPHLIFPEAEFSLWIDGSISINKHVSVWNLINKHLNEQGADMAVFEHPHRFCLYDEATHCMKQELDSPEIIFRQMCKYAKDEFPYRAGLYECPVILRKHSKKMTTFNEHWWSQIVENSKRDQISFPYSVKKTGVKVVTFDEQFKENAAWLKKFGHYNHPQGR